MKLLTYSRCRRSVFMLFWIIRASFGELDPSATDLPEPLSQIASLVNETFPDRSIFLGGQNFTRCCLQAVSESYDLVSNGSAVLTSDPSQQYLDWAGDRLDAKDFQFPCGAAYQQGQDDGAPLVAVPYTWCSSNCGGWSRSRNQALSQWIQPFVGFILPAAIFCLNVSSSSFSLSGCADRPAGTTQGFHGRAR